MDVFKENKSFWFYLVGIVVLFVVLLWGGNYFLRGNQLFGKKEKVETTTPSTFDEPPLFTIDTDEDYVAEFKTNIGNFTIDLYERNAPVNVNNFVFLATQNYYDGLIVHRMIADLFIQSGSRATLNDNSDDDDLGNPGYTVIDEINWDSLDFSQSKRQELTEEGYKTNPDVSSKKMKKYSLVMANSKDKSNSAGSQYFIVIADDADPRLEYLRGRHTVIGEVIEGQDVLDKVRDLNTVESGSGNTIIRPESEIKIETVTILIND